MIGRLLRWTGGILLAVALLAILATFWLVGTQSGARWLLAQGSPYFPDALRVDQVSGTLLRTLEFRNVEWRDPAVDVTVAEIATTLELMPLFRREVRITSLTIGDVDIALGDGEPRETDPAPFSIDLPISLQLITAAINDVRIATSDSEFAINTVRLGGALEGSELSIRRFDLQSSQADIALSGQAQLSGDLPLDAHAAWELRLQDQPALSGLLRLRGDTTRYEVEHDLDAPYAVETRGTIAFVDERVSVNLKNQWQQIRFQQGDAAAMELAEGVLTITGTPDSIEFDGTTSLSSVDIPPTAIETRGNFEGGRFNFRSLSVVNEWGNLLAQGVVDIADGPGWSFDLALSELNPAVADARLHGSLEVVGKTSGRLVENTPDVELAINRLSGELNGNPVSGKGLFSYAKERLKFRDAVIAVGDNRVDLDGAYGPGLTIDARARLPDLSQLGLGIAGLLNSDFRIESKGDRFAASGYVSGENLAWNENVVDKLRADFKLPDAGDGTISLDLDLAEQGGLTASLDGRFVNEQWLGTIRDLAVRREPVGEWTLQEATGFSVSRAALELDKACLGTATGGGRVCVQANYDFSGPLNFESTVSALPVSTLPRYLPQGASVLGEIDAEASGNFVDGRINATASLRITGLGLTASYEGEDVSATFEKAATNIDVIDNRLVGAFEFRLEGSNDHASGDVEIADLFDSRSALRGVGSLELGDLSLLSFFVPDVANPLGTIAGSVQASGSLVAPEISGEISLREGSADIRRAGISVTDIGLLLRQSKAGELSLQGSARSGDGYLRINGETTFGAATGIRSEIRLNGEDFQLLRLPDWQVAASPEIAVLFDERRTKVSGELGIPEASITVKTVPETTEKPSGDAIVHRGDTAVIQQRRMLFVDVTTTLGDDVSFSGFGLSTDLQGSVRISGDNKTPYNAFGRVVLREGRYQAYGQNLEIESGELIFNGPLGNPTLNVRAARTASDKTVAGIHLSGTPAQLRSEVYSEPPLSDAEALSYLLTGRPLSSANSEEGDMLNQAAFALGLTTAGSVASRVRNQLGLETLGIQGGADNRQLVAGKRISDRLFVEYAYGVVDSLGTLLLRYQLSRRLMVESRSGSVRNVDVVYSVKKP